ncbi:MAG TPA: phosphoenolpyruvate carboxykinase (ATP) [Gemmataceae bacterium]|nr:phosphoenolpyruvate carboxykinase (ATP) [Gemmataceae bacterium]
MRSPDLSRHGLAPAGPIYAYLSAPELVEHALRRQEGNLADSGAFNALTGERTARSPKDKYVVRDPSIEKEIDWGKVNQPMTPAVFDRLLRKAIDYANGRELFVEDAAACADPNHRLTVRVVAEQAWHALFARCLFRPPTVAELESDAPEWLVLGLPGLRYDAAAEGINSPVVIALSFERKIALVAGTHYAGEIKKGIFSVLNGVLPLKGVFPMHCSANIGAGGDVALFFGLSGTGKTTLSADPERRLIGDDEHGWSDDGVFNIEGGCYAKTIKLSAEKEPQIFSAIRFGSVLENVPLDPGTRRPDYDSQLYTENTRAAYPLDFIANYEPTGRGGHPKTIFFLTCDAFGVMPPIARLNLEQAMAYFLCGYTAKVAGTEVGVKDPTAEFSTCFAAPFLPLPPRRYAQLLGEKLKTHKAPVWLLNTGWIGGGFGGGERISLTYTRAMLHAALEGKLDGVTFRNDPIFGIAVPTTCPGVPSEILDPRASWSDKPAYDRAATDLAKRFADTLAKYR